MPVLLEPVLLGPASLELDLGSAWAGVAGFQGLLDSACLELVLLDFGLPESACLELVFLDLDLGLFDSVCLEPTCLEPLLGALLDSVLLGSICLGPVLLDSGLLDSACLEPVVLLVMLNTAVG